MNKPITREEFVELYKSYGFGFISGYKENMTREQAIKFLEVMSAEMEVQEDE